MSAFDLCTKTTADSSWTYNNVIFINIKNNVNFLVSEVDSCSSVCSNSFNNDNDKHILEKTIISNLSKCNLK